MRGARLSLLCLSLSLSLSVSLNLSSGSLSLLRSLSAAPRELGARLPLENERLLTPLFVKLQARLDEPQGGVRVRVSHVGDSHIIADFWTGEMRERLQRRFGDGGRGFVLPGKGWRSFSQRHIYHRTEGDWGVKSIKRDRSRGWFGPGGCLFQSDNPQDRLEVFTKPTQPASHFDRLSVLSLASSTGGSFELEVDDLPYGRYSTHSAHTHLLKHTLSLSEGAHTISLRPVSAGREVTLFGFSLERSGGGVIYDSIGLNGAQAKQQLKNTQGALNAAFKALNSDLIILSYGINELFDRSWTLERYERELTLTLKALREAAPEATCLLTGPFAAMLKGRPHPELDAMYGVQRALAARFGCAFWDARAAMGDTLKPWQSKGLARRDGIHLTLRGYQRIAELFEQSLELSFERWRSSLKDATPLDEPTQLDPQAKPTLKVQQRR